jgi:hypothetical protein
MTSVKTPRGGDYWLEFNVDREFPVDFAEDSQGKIYLGFVKA